MPLVSVLDRESARRDAIAEILGHVGYGTLKAHSVEAALAILVDMTPDVIRPDPMMTAADRSHAPRSPQGRLEHHRNCVLAGPFAWR